MGKEQRAVYSGGLIVALWEGVCGGGGGGGGSVVVGDPPKVKKKERKNSREGLEVSIEDSNNSAVREPTLNPMGPQPMHRVTAKYPYPSKRLGCGRCK